MHHNNTLPIIFIFLFIFALSTAAWIAFNAGLTMSENEIQGAVFSQPKSIDAFTLEDNKQRAFTPENLKGKWSILYFGYTRCTDNCPAILTTLKLVHDLLVINLAKPHQVVFITVDHLHDNPATLDAYLGEFDNDFVGVTGSADDLAKFAGNLDIEFKQATKSDAIDDGRIAHSTSLVLVDPEARIKAILVEPYRVGDLHNDIMTIIENKLIR